MNETVLRYEKMSDKNQNSLTKLWNHPDIIRYTNMKEPYFMISSVLSADRPSTRSEKYLCFSIKSAKNDGIRDRDNCSQMDIKQYGRKIWRLHFLCGCRFR